MGSKVNSKQASVQWFRDFTKAKLNLFFIPIFFIKTVGKEEKREIWTILRKFGQVRTSFDKATN